MAEQEFATGVDRLPNGHPVEYVVPRGPGLQPVDFDGFLRRGDPPVEVYQEVKGDYSFIDKFKNPESMWSKQLQKFVDQAERQRTAIGSGPELEWIFTRNPELVELVQDLFADQGIDVTVRYVPLCSMR